MTIFTINTECGLLADIQATDIDDAKEQYSAKFGFDFDDVASYPGSWYWVSDEYGMKIESHEECMPQ